MCCQEKKKSSAAAFYLCCCERCGFGLLSEQSDREANECWLNRWVVTLLHWRGFTGDMMHCFTEVVGWQWDHSVGCLCVKCQSVTISEARGVADMCLPHSLNRCLHNLSTALALFHWQFVTSPEFLFRPPYVSFGTVDSVLLVSEWVAGVTATPSPGSSFFRRMRLEWALTFPFLLTSLCLNYKFSLLEMTSVHPIFKYIVIFHTNFVHCFMFLWYDSFLLGFEIHISAKCKI